MTTRLNLGVASLFSALLLLLIFLWVRDPGLRTAGGPDTNAAGNGHTPSERPSHRESNPVQEIAVPAPRQRKIRCIDAETGCGVRGAVVCDAERPDTPGERADVEGWLSVGPLASARFFLVNHPDYYGGVYSSSEEYLVLCRFPEGLVFNIRDSMGLPVEGLDVSIRALWKSPKGVAPFRVEILSKSSSSCEVLAELGIPYSLTFSAPGTKSVKHVVVRGNGGSEPIDIVLPTLVLAGLSTGDVWPLGDTHIVGFALEAGLNFGEAAASDEPVWAQEVAGVSWVALELEDADLYPPVVDLKLGCRSAPYSEADYQVVMLRRDELREQDIVRVLACDDKPTDSVEICFQRDGLPIDPGSGWALFDAAGRARYRWHPLSTFAVEGRSIVHTNTGTFRAVLELGTYSIRDMQWPFPVGSDAFRPVEFAVGEDALVIVPLKTTTDSGAVEIQCTGAVDDGIVHLLRREGRGVTTLPLRSGALKIGRVAPGAYRAIMSVPGFLAEDAQFCVEPGELERLEIVLERDLEGAADSRGGMSLLKAALLQE